jgi:hypothetical protein
MKERLGLESHTSSSLYLLYNILLLKSQAYVLAIFLIKVNFNTRQIF